MAREAGSDWISHLPAVLMGLRASVREDSAVSPAELVFGQPFRLPGSFFEASSVKPEEPPSVEFVRDLRTRLASVLPHPVVFHGVPPSAVPSALLSAKAVFLRVDSVRRPLVPPYEGPFEVLESTAKTFTILKNSKSVVVLIDRVKPAFALPPASVRSSASAQTDSFSDELSPEVYTRSGRISRPPVRFASPLVTN